MSIQTILRIETVNNRVIELMQVGEEYRMGSRHVAPDLAQEWEGFLLAWQDCFKHAWVPTAQLAAKIKGNPTHPLAKCLPAPLKTATTEEGFSIRLGKALYSRVEVLYGTLRIECSRHSHTKSACGVFYQPSGSARTHSHSSCVRRSKAKAEV